MLELSRTRSQARVCGLQHVLFHCVRIEKAIRPLERDLREGNAQGCVFEAQKTIDIVKEALHKTIKKLQHTKKLCDHHCVRVDLSRPYRLSVIATGDFTDEKVEDESASGHSSNDEGIGDIDSSVANISQSEQRLPPNGLAVGYLLPPIERCLEMLDMCFGITDDQYPKDDLRPPYIRKRPASRVSDMSISDIEYDVGVEDIDPEFGGEDMDSYREIGSASGTPWKLKPLGRAIVESRKIDAIADLFVAACETPLDSIVMVHPSDFVIKAIETPDGRAESLARSMKRFYSRLEKVKCVSHRMFQNRQRSTGGYLAGFSSMLYYAFHGKEAEHDSVVLSVDPDAHYIRFMWNLPEMGFIHSLHHISFPAIKHTFCFMISPTSVPGYAHPSQPEVLARVLSPTIIPSGIPARDRHPSRSCCGCFDDRMVSLSFSEHVHLSGESGRSSTDCQTPQVSPQAIRRSHPSPSYMGKALVLHFHGGGFIAQTSFSHQNYTRQWAKDAELPVISCDYRLAPENPYPAPFEDAWLCYQWCLHNAESALGFKPERIVLAGDSAGGNLCAAVTIRAIQTGERVPDGLFLAYPALCVTTKKFYPSTLECLEETMVPFGFLLKCMSSYAPDAEQALRDPLLSPSVASDQTLARFPPTRIMVGSRDPLLDQSVEFAERLRHQRIDVKLRVYQQFPHGFLSFDSPFVGVKESHSCVQQSSEWIRELASAEPIPSNAEQ